MRVDPGGGDDGGTDTSRAEFDGLYKKHPRIEKAYADFIEFKSIVEQDLLQKIKDFSEFRNAETLKRSDRNYANIQIFMLKTYLKRSSSFHEDIKRSQTSIQGRSKMEKEETIQALVEQHLGYVNRLKTRLKHILDVSEKYATMDIFDQLCHVVNETQVDGPGFRSLPRHAKSMEVLSGAEIFNSTSSLPHPSNKGKKKSSHQSQSTIPVVPLPPSPLPTFLLTPASHKPAFHKQSLQTSSFKILFPNKSSSPAPSPTSSATPSPPSSPDSASSVSPSDMSSEYRKRASSLQSITKHLAVLRKTYSNNRR